MGVCLSLLSNIVCLTFELIITLIRKTETFTSELVTTHHPLCSYSFKGASKEKISTGLLNTYSSVSWGSVLVCSVRLFALHLKESIITSANKKILEEKQNVWKDF